MQAHNIPNDNNHTVNSNKFLSGTNHI